MKLARPVLALLALALSLALVAPAHAAYPQFVFGSGGSEGDEYGRSVAMSGSTAVVGAPGSDAAHVFTRSGTSWTPVTTLTASDTTDGDRFGSAVAVDGNIIAIGAENDASAGSVYLFHRDAAGTWSELQKIYAGSHPGSRYGHSLALQGYRLLVGAPGSNVRDGTSHGAVHLVEGFEFEQGPWFIHAGHIEGWPGVEMGTSVALDGDRFVVGSPGPDHYNWSQGRAYVYAVTEGTFFQHPQRVSVLGGADDDAHDRFGSSVAIDGDTILVGAPAAGTTDAGAAYVFKRTTPGAFRQEWQNPGTRLAPEGAAAGDRFGASVQLEPGVAVVGAPDADVAGITDAGAAHVFAAVGDEWPHVKRHAGGSGHAGARLTAAIATAGSVLLAGAPTPSGGGKAFAFAPLVSAPKLLRSPVLTGTREAGHVLTSSTGTWSPGVTAYRYRWQRCMGNACAPIAGTADADDGDSTYALTAADEGRSIMVTVTATSAGGSRNANSARTSAIGAPVASANPRISGVAQTGRVLTSSTGTWSLAPASYAYRWQRCSGSTCTTVADGGSATHTLTPADSGHRMRVLVTAANAAGSATATSGQTAVVDLPVNTVRPAVSGVKQAGQTVTATSGTWTPVPDAYAYAWQRCSGSACTTVATGSAYALTAADSGRTVRAVITATNAAGSATAYSGAVAIP